MQKAMKNIYFYIPIEIKTREFHAKTLLACVTAESGLNVVLGQKEALRKQITHLPKGIILYHGINENFSRDIQFLSEKGFIVVAQDEEGLVYFNPEFYQKFRISCNSIHNLKFFFAWGKHQANCIGLKCPDSVRKIFLTGNSRFDLLRPEIRGIFKEEIESIHKKFGKFILINTNFGACNHFNGADYYIQSLNVKGWTRIAEDKEYHIRRIQHVSATFDHFQKMVFSLSQQYPNIQFVLRPHPSENVNRWENLLKDCANVKIIHEGNVIPWLCAAELMIHNGCTTAVESVIAETPTVSFIPFEPGEYDLFLPNTLGYPAKTIEELNAIIESFGIHGKQTIIAYNQQRKKEILTEYIVGFEGEFASERIAETICSIDGLEENYRNEDIIRPHDVSLPFLSNLRNIPTWIEKFKGRKTEKYVLHKFGGLTQKEIEVVIRKLQECTGRFHDISVTPISDQVFLIKKAS